MIRKLSLVLSGAMLLAAAGCGNGDDTATLVPATQPSPGGAPTFGTPSGMGFSTGDAAHSDGQGSGLMGYHGTGAMGASNAITDEHPVPRPDATTTQPVLPAP